MRRVTSIVLPVNCLSIGMGLRVHVAMLNFARSREIFRHITGITESNARFRQWIHYSRKQVIDDIE
jgi:hypothetical protein